MFIHRNNVEQYAHTRPKPKRLPTAVANCTPATLQPYETTSSSSSRPRRPASIPVVSGAKGGPQRRFQHNVFATPHAPHEYSNSDSDEITVEEIFPSGPFSGVRSARDTSHSVHSARATEQVRLPSRYSDRDAQDAEPDAAAAQCFLRSRVSAHGLLFSSTAALTSYAPTAQGGTIEGVGGVSPLSHVSPGESRISEADGVRREGHRLTTRHDARVSHDVNTPAKEMRDASDAESTADDGQVCRNLLTTSTANGASIVAPLTRQSPPEEQHHHQLSEGQAAQKESSGPESSTPMQTITAVLVHDGNRAESTRTSASPVSGGASSLLRTEKTEEDEVGERVHHIPHLRSVSELGRTLTAATKALAAAAQREAQRREEEDARAQVTLIPSIAANVVYDTLLSVALKEKVLLFDVFFATLQRACAAVDECTALHRRDADRARRETDYAAKDQERATQHKMALYRQHVAAEALRAEAETRHAEQLREAEARVAELAETVKELKRTVALQEVSLRDQEQRHAAAMHARLRDVHEGALELRALQKAHGQATERWMSLQVLYNAFQDRKAMQRELDFRQHRRQQRRLQQQQQQRQGQRKQRITFHEPSEVIHEGYAATRVIPITNIPSPREEEEESEVRLLNYHPRDDHNAGYNGVREEEENEREDAAPPDLPAGLNTTGGEPTALEALLARTRSDSGMFITSPVQSSSVRYEAARRSSTPRSAERAAPAVHPPARGGFSSPPDTPLLLAATSTPFKAGPVAMQLGSASRSSDVTPSPDAKPTVKARRVVADLAASPPLIGDDRGSTAGAAQDQRGDSARQPSSSSFRPSRLNSVASTRQGSSSGLLNNVATTATQGFRVYEEEEGALREEGVVSLRAKGTEVRRYDKDNEEEEEDGEEHEEEREVDEEEEEERESAEWQEYMAHLAAVVVRQELARLLAFSLTRKASSTSAAMHTSTRSEVRAITATQQQQRQQKQRQQQQRQQQQTPVNGSTGSSRLDDSSFLSTPRVNLLSLSSLQAGKDAAVEEAMAPTVSLSALQWMRVCETAHLSAEMTCGLGDKLRALSDSLSQRIQLLEEKDWNKTMAKQFIAVDHAAALRRLIAKVDKAIQGSLLKANVTPSSAKVSAAPQK